jgi:hypothetical protein
MKDPVEGEAKYKIARRTLEQVMDELPAHFQVGFRAFGHMGFWKEKAGQPADDDPRWNTDSELLIAIGPLDQKNHRQLIKDWINYLKPAGATPLVYSLLHAHKDLSSGWAGPKMVVVVGQGNEWVTIQNHSDAASNMPELSENMRARIKQDLNAGCTVVVPKKAIVIDGRLNETWWRLDPRNGQTLGMGGRGWGASDMVESSVVHNVVTIALVGAALFYIGYCVITTTDQFQKNPLNTEDGRRCLFAGALCAIAIIGGAITEGWIGLAIGGLVCDASILGSHIH